MEKPTISRIAAITPHALSDVDTLLSNFAQAQLEQGWRLQGLLQETVDNAQSCEITLIDLLRGTRYLISQNLGSGSTACCLNTASMADASLVLRQVAHETVDLVIFNRFGKQEAAGQGFSAEMLALMSQEVPVLTVVQDHNLAAWQHFTGGMAIELPAEQTALEAWFAAVCRR